MTFKRVVNAVEVAVLVAAAVFVVLLFANESGPSYRAGSAGSGASLFSANCARCHGAGGGGGIGPQLSGGKVVRDFPDVADQVTFVTQGQGGMPAFGGTLSAKQIREVVDYTRTL
ncbi:MAG TPA: cytochrome c [Acidimicrobiia bacterium]|jgi:mono/diheme cytochrome c family protein